MNRTVRWLSVLLVCVACASTQPAPAARPDPSRPTRVLFIGNSYTYYNNLPQMLEGFVQALVPGGRLETRSVLVGGATLESHWKRGEAQALIRDGGWDYVVLQEQSLLGGLRINGVAHLNAPEERFYPYARRFAQEATAAGARPLFYMTWSRKHDLAAQEALTHAYATIAREQRGVLSPVGVAWLRVRREQPGLELYSEDGHHPAPAGTYLAACVLFASLYQQPCLGAPSTLTGAPWTDTAFDSSRSEPLVALPEATARYLQQVGSEVALSSELPASGALADSSPMPASLPRGSPWPAGKATWTGTLALYPVERGLGSLPIHLSLDPHGARPSGRLRIVLPQGAPLEADVEPRMEDNVVSFSLQDATLLETTVHFRAVYLAGGLRGEASAQDGQGGRWFGSWSARQDGLP